MVSYGNHGLEIHIMCRITGIVTKNQVREFLCYQMTQKMVNGQTIIIRTLLLEIVSFVLRTGNHHPSIDNTYFQELHEPTYIFNFFKWHIIVYGWVCNKHYEGCLSNIYVKHAFELVFKMMPDNCTVMFLFHQKLFQIFY